MSTDVAVPEKIRTLFEDWGWETGQARLRDMIAAAQTDKERKELELCAGWLAMERGRFDEAFVSLNNVASEPALQVWALIGSAFMLLREKDYESARSLLDEADRLPSPQGSVTPAYIAHLRGTLYYHTGNDKAARAELFKALQLFTKRGPGYGRALDTLGMVYMTDNDFYLSRLFYESALKVKQEYNDVAGIALTYGQLGRLYLEYGLLSQANEAFQRDQELCWKLADLHGVAITSNAIGQVALARGQWAEASAILDDAIQRNAANGWQVQEAYARKDRALACLHLGELDAAETQIRAADKAFSELFFEEGRAHVGKAWGMLCAARGQSEQAAEALRKARLYFQEYGEPAEAARVQREEARLLKAQQGSGHEAAQAYLNARSAALQSLRFCLAAEIEHEFRQVLPVEYALHVCHLPEEPVSDEETARRSFLESLTQTAEGTLLSVEMLNFEAVVQSSDQDVIALTYNCLMARLSKSVADSSGAVISRSSTGFAVFFTGNNHAEQAQNAVHGILKSRDACNRVPQSLDYVGLEISTSLTSGQWTLTHAVETLKSGEAGRPLAMSTSRQILLRR